MAGHVRKDLRRETGDHFGQFVLGCAGLPPVHHLQAQVLGLAIRALRARIGDDAVYGRFPQTELFDRIGMTRTIAETDFQGNFVLSSQVWSTARDLARFGLLYLNDGVAHGERILPADWRRFVSTPSGPQPDGPFGYGAGFWLLDKSAGVPSDAFGAFGNRGQYVVIIPSRRLVIVRQGYDDAAQRLDIAKLTAAVVAGDDKAGARK